QAEEAEEAEETDPDLVREYSMLETMVWGSIFWGNRYFFLVNLREYTDRLVLNFEASAVDSFDSESIEITISEKEPTGIYQFEIEGHLLRLDVERCKLWGELMETEGEWITVNPWVSFAEGFLFRVEKEYAEHNLSGECLDYAALTRKDDGYYYWEMQKGHHAVVLAELRTLFWPDVWDEDGTWAITKEMETLLKMLQEHCYRYCMEKELGPMGWGGFRVRTKEKEIVENGIKEIHRIWKDLEFIEQFRGLQKDPLWEPEQ
ncbi:MAG: hypothetical protein Q4C06_07950, partial [Bacillota bacterium]|nr:hypothetical protein [Bacillota bacterium]